MRENYSGGGTAQPERRRRAANAHAQLAHHASQHLRVWWYLGQKWLSAQLTQPVALSAELKARMPQRARILADLDELIAQDWRNIEAGDYAMPEHIVPRPLVALRRAGRYIADLGAVDARRRAHAHDEVRHAGKGGDYPSYYLQNFHYQTDGYLSRRSAELYDHQVEVLFGGGADAMRRQALVPLRRALAARGVRRATLLDLACGTGRLLRDIKRNYPLLKVTGLDLSPDYLAVAGEALAPWSGTRLIAAPAERVPLPEASFDIVTCVYLFHELPPRVRRQVAREMSRLLRPGGTAIFVDSIQLGDCPEFDPLLEHFPLAFHEPYFASFVKEDLAQLFAAAGLDLIDRTRAHFSTVLTLRKPA